MRHHGHAPLVLLALAAALTLAPTGIAAPPANDNFADATVVSSLPYTQTLSIVEATTESGEPGTPWSVSRTVWWTFSPPTDVFIRTTQGGCCQFLSVFRADGSGFAGLTPITGEWVPYGRAFELSGEATYYFQSGDGSPYGWTSTISLTLEHIVPPANDDFADAIAFSSVPFSDSREMTAATLEQNEPKACAGSFENSIWYAFTPATSGSYGQHGTSSLNVYTGSSLADLTSVACSDWPGLYFYGDAGTTYYIQATNGGVSLDFVPPPNPAWSFSPGDPSRFADVTFRHGLGYWDPTITEYLWDFGDGATGSGQEVLHRYVADGDYEVTLIVNARGSRTATQTQTIHVATPPVQGTHDGSEGLSGLTGSAACTAEGWAFQPARPSTDLTVRVLVDDLPVATGVASEFRQDLRDAGIGDGTAAFSIDISAFMSSGDEHEVRVQAQDVDSDGWTDLAGTPKRLTCTELYGNHDAQEGMVARRDCAATGWAFDAQTPTMRVRVRLKVNGKVVAETTADELREDVRDAGYGDGFSGWTVDLFGKVKPGQEAVVMAEARDTQAKRLWFALWSTEKRLTCLA